VIHDPGLGVGNEIPSIQLDAPGRHLRLRGLHPDTLGLSSKEFFIWAGLVSVSDQTDVNRSIDAALIALARDQIWRDDEAPARREPPVKAEASPPNLAEASPPNLAPASLIDRLRFAPDWSLTLGALALFALMPLAAALFLWGSLYSQVERARVSTASVSKELAAKPLLLKSSEAEPRAEASETSPQATERMGKNEVAIAPVASAATPNLQSVATLTRQSAEAQQAIEKLTAEQARMLSENAELDKQLKEARETVRQNERLVDDLKAAQTQLVQDKARLEGQLQASEQQVANTTAKLSASRDDAARMEVKLGASQEKTTSLLSQKQQRQRPRQLSAGNNPPTTIPTASLRQPKPSSSPNPASLRAKNAQKSAIAGGARPTDPR